MKKFRFWAVFGLVFNGVALIRGIGYALALTPHFSALSIGTALCSAIGIYCSILILKQNAKGFRLAKRQVWFVAAHEAIAIHLSHNGTTIPGVAVTLGALGSAALLYKLFSSPEARQYSKQAASTANKNLINIAEANSFQPSLVLGARVGELR